MNQIRIISELHLGATKTQSKGHKWPLGCTLYNPAVNANKIGATVGKKKSNFNIKC